MTDQQRLPACGVSDIIIDPNFIPGTTYHNLYIAYGQVRWNNFGLGVLESTDNGVSWQQTGLNPTTMGGWGFVEKLLMHPTNHLIIYAITSSDVYETIDGGINWSSLGFPAYLGSNDGELYQISFDPLNTNIIYLAGKKLWRFDPSLPLTLKWLDITGLLSSTIPKDGTFRISEANSKLLVLYQENSGTSNKIDVSIDGGYNWIYNSTPNFFGNLFIVNPLNTNIMYVGFNGYIHVAKSIDGGTNFFDMAGNHDDIRALKLIYPSYTGENDFILSGNDGGISYSTSGLNIATTPPTPTMNWYKINGYGLNITQIWGFGGTETDNQLLICGTQDNRIIKYDNGIWNSIGSTCDDYDMVFDPNYEGTVYGQEECWWDGLSLIKSTDNGNDNFNKNIPQTGEIGNYIKPMKVRKNDGLLYIAYGGLYKSTTPVGAPYSSSYTKITDFQASPYNIPDCSSINALEINEEYPLIMYLAVDGPTWNLDQNTCPLHCDPSTPCTTSVACQSGICPVSKKIFRTNDGGVTWNDISDVNQDMIDDLSAVRWFGITGIAMNPDNPDEVYVTFNGIAPSENNSRVMRSLDGGQTWSDYSDGLREFPVSCIKFQKGANALYIGTDIGVFYRKTDNPSSQWECFNKDLPISSVTDLEINYCSQKIRAATFGRGIWESDLVPYTTTLASSETWSSPRKLYSDLIVPTGLTLTITSEVDISSNKKIMINTGGKLIIDGGVLTNSCGLMWQGIEIKGTSTSSQLPIAGNTNQGEVELINGATIENAIEAVKVDGGGLITATDATFKNNVRGVEFDPYGFNNLSSFKNCTFETTDVLNDPSQTPEEFVILNGVKGINFLGNTFQNTSGTLLWTDKGIGIKSCDASYSIDHYCTSQFINPCTSYQPNTFKNLKIAISANNTNPSIPLTITGNEFNDNFRAIELGGINSAVIKNNNIYVGENGGPSYLNIHKADAYGLYLEGCTGYNVSGNSFIADQGGTYGYGRYAILDYNSGTHANLIYNNSFSNFQIAAIQSEGINGDINWMIGDNQITSKSILYQGAGLVFKCNSFSNDVITDIAITSGNIAENQGYCFDNTTPAGNTFSTGLMYNIMANQTLAGPVHYYYHQNSSVSGVLLNPNVTPNIYKYPCVGSTYDNNSCPIPSPINNLQLIADIQSENSLISAKKALFDGGNTQGLLDEVNSSSYSLSQLKTDLLAASPYLQNTLHFA